MNRHLQVAGVAAHGEVELRRHALPQPREPSSKWRVSTVSPERGRARARTCTMGYASADTRRLQAGGPRGSGGARAGSRLDQGGHGTALGQRSFWNKRADDSDGPSRARPPRSCSRCRTGFSPSPCAARSGATITSMPQGRVDFLTQDGEPDRHRGAVADERRTLARHPDQRSAWRRAGIAPELQSQRSCQPSAASLPKTRR